MLLYIVPGTIDERLLKENAVFIIAFRMDGSNSTAAQQSPSPYNTLKTYLPERALEFSVLLRNNHKQCIFFLISVIKYISLHKIFRFVIIFGFAFI